MGLAHYPGVSYAMNVDSEDSGALVRLCVMRPLRGLLLFKLGAWAGMMAAAAFVRRAVPSEGDEESDELRLVAVLNGITLVSRARAFTGGSMLAWYGGIDVDLREVELAPDARLSLNTLFGGIAIKTPPGWRVESEMKAIAGGIDTRTTSHDDPDAPVLTLTGTALFGGVAVGAKVSTNGPTAAADGPLARDTAE
jgi:hypothetical protein